MLISDHKYIAFFAYTEIYTLFFGKNIFCFNNLPVLGCLRLFFFSIPFYSLIKLNVFFQMNLVINVNNILLV